MKKYGFQLANAKVRAKGQILALALARARAALTRNVVHTTAADWGLEGRAQKTIFVHWVSGLGLQFSYEKIVFLNNGFL